MHDARACKGTSVRDHRALPKRSSVSYTMPHMFGGGGIRHMPPGPDETGSPVSRRRAPARTPHLLRVWPGRVAPKSRFALFWWLCMNLQVLLL